MAKDKTTNLGDIENMEIQRLLPKATIQDLATRSSITLREALKLAENREKHEQEQKQEFERKTRKPRQKVQEAVYLVEHAKQNIRESETEEDLFEAGTEYETALKHYQNVFNELSKIDTSTSNQCFDPIPSINNVNERLRFLGTMRGIWKQKKV